jgi:hypothetical protein
LKEELSGCMPAEDSATAPLVESKLRREWKIFLKCSRMRKILYGGIRGKRFLKGLSG